MNEWIILCPPFIAFSKMPHRMAFNPVLQWICSMPRGSKLRLHWAAPSYSSVYEHKVKYSVLHGGAVCIIHSHYSICRLYHSCGIKISTIFSLSTYEINLLQKLMYCFDFETFTIQYYLMFDVLQAFLLHPAKRKRQKTFLPMFRCLLPNVSWTRFLKLADLSLDKWSTFAVDLIQDDYHNQLKLSKDAKFSDV